MTKSLHSDHTRRSAQRFHYLTIWLRMQKSHHRRRTIKSSGLLCCSSNRTCQRPMYSKQGTSAFIQPKMGREGDEVDSTQVRQGPSRLARPSAAYFSAMGDQNQEEGTQDEGEGEVGGQTQAPPAPDRPLQRMVTAIPRRMEERIGVMNSEGGLEIMSAVRTHTARQILKRKKKVGDNGLGGGGCI